MPTERTLTETEHLVLTTCRDLEAEIAGRKNPPKSQHWERVDFDELKRYGPRYLPSAWFGGGRPLPEKHRVRYLRAVNRLIEAGLLAGTTSRDSNRLQHIKLTPAGIRAIAPPADKGE